MKCLRCNNEEEKYFYYDQTAWYCRKCIMFGRVNVGTLPKKRELQKQPIACSPVLAYPLTIAQKKASQQLLSHVAHHCDCLVFACCGAGKTEIVMEVIASYITKGKKVGFAISRRQVVLEIRDRMAEAFPTLQVVAVCEGHTEIDDGDLIIATMHQLYRYHQSFDLLIMDEVDAFPYRGNDVLKAIAMHACTGEKIYLTATPDDEMMIEVKQGKLQLIEVFQRPHGYPLIVPEVHCGMTSLQNLRLLHFLYEQHRQKVQTLVFVPTIKIAHHLYHCLRLLYKCAVFTSKTNDKEQLIHAFHQQAYEFLIATTVLERGITIRGIYVVVLYADHPVFNEASLIQMIGRVGRRMEMPTGKGLLLCTHKTKDIEHCITTLTNMNEQGG